MTELFKHYAQGTPDDFRREVEQRSDEVWRRAGCPSGRRAEFAARVERRLRARLRQAVRGAA